MANQELQKYLIKSAEEKENNYDLLNNEGIKPKGGFPSINKSHTLS